MIPLLELERRDWHLGNPIHWLKSCSQACSLSAHTRSQHGSKAHAWPWGLWRRELGWCGLCASFRFGLTCSWGVTLCFGAGQLCLIALVQVLPTELGWTFVVVLGGGVEFSPLQPCRCFHRTQKLLGQLGPPRLLFGLNSILQTTQVSMCLLFRFLT